MAANGDGGYFNVGLDRWESGRRTWRETGGTSATPPGPAQAAALQSGPPRTRARGIDIEDVVEAVFASSSNGQLPYKVPLPQMIDLLVDLWEADGCVLGTLAAAARGGAL